MSRNLTIAWDMSLAVWLMGKGFKSTTLVERQEEGAITRGMAFHAPAVSRLMYWRTHEQKSGDD